MVATSSLGRAGVPIRLRLTAVFAVVVAVALALIGVVVYLVFRQGLDARIDEELADRQEQVALLARDDPDPAAIVARAGEPLIQVYGPDGEAVASSSLLTGARLLTPDQVRAARRAPIMAGPSRLPGLGDGARVRAFAVPGDRVVAVGESRDARERTLHRLAAILGLALPLAVVVASAAGYRVARAALQPVDAMSSQAAAIGTGDLTGRLVAPGTRDELDRLAVTLNDLLSRLQRAVEQERRIVGDASHELRTPVSVLLTRLDVALRGDGDLQQLRVVLSDARQDARRLARLADDLLLLARVDQGALPVTAAPLEVHDLLTAAVHRNAGAVGAGRALRVVSEIPGGAVVLADADRTGQVLDNLIANAARHGAGDVELAATHRGDEVEIAVRDHGGGYPPQFLGRAFERFSQAPGARQGSGLGLAIVWALVQAQGGSVTAANHPEGGAVTVFTLPLA